jgi:hypothetical protein
MIETISYRLLEEVPWGLKMRVTVGAVTSMADLLTDLYVTYMVWNDGKSGYFKASLASLAVSAGFQMLVVWGQNRKLGMKRVLRELFPILIGLKPAVDAYRVTKGTNQEAGRVLPALTELTYIKVVEMFAEAIPGVIIQLMAIVTATYGKHISKGAWLSLVVSALTTGFASSTISYDFDTDPQKRRETPDFYGYVPTSSSKRFMIFASMTLFSAGMLLIRCMTIVVLGQIRGSWAALYIGGDLCVYLAVKMARGDFWYWAPAGGNIEIFSSILARVLIKTVTDFTSIVHFRHPNEVGGFYWMFGFVLTMGSLPVATILAESNPEVDGEQSIARTVVIYIIPLTMLSFAVFLSKINKEFVGTFFSFQRGKDLTVKGFSGEKDDATKAAFSIQISRKHWVSIENDVKNWVESNWERWEEEKPDWFTDQIKAAVPEEFIPATGGARRRESVRRASVDEEAEGVLGGTLRASIRRASVGTTLGGDAARVVPIEEDS